MQAAIVVIVRTNKQKVLFIHLAGVRKGKWFVPLCFYNEHTAALFHHNECRDSHQMFVFRCRLIGGDKWKQRQWSHSIRSLELEQRAEHSDESAKHGELSHSSPPKSSIQCLNKITGEGVHLCRANGAGLKMKTAGSTDLTRLSYHLSFLGGDLA